MQLFTQQGHLAIATELYNFIEQEALPQSGINSQQYWQQFEKIVLAFTQRNKDLLAKREHLQSQIDAWHQNNTFDLDTYKSFLTDIGYLLPEIADFQVTTSNVDEEIAQLAGPQLVVPLRNARYSLNAANARWGSLYDALYGTDMIDDQDGAEQGAGYNPIRGAKVIAFAKDFLDENFALSQGSYHDAVGFSVLQGQLQVTLSDGTLSHLQQPTQCVGFNGDTKIQAKSF